MTAVFWKELRDHFSSYRFIILVFMIVIICGAAVYTAAENVRGDVRLNPTDFVFIRVFTTSGDTLPSFLAFISFFGPIIGIIFGFDAINSERTGGTLSRILSQPLFRDSVINGKFLAGFVTIAILMAAIVLGTSVLGIAAIGIRPSSAEVLRIFIFYILTLLYVGFWLGVGVLCSVLFKKTVTSALVPFSIWIFFLIFMSMIAGLIADWQEPIDRYSQPEEEVNHQDIQDKIALISPVVLYSEASDIVLSPERRTLHGITQARMEVNPELTDFTPVSVRQSLKLTGPHLIVLIALTAICFAASYIRFVKEEIRST